MQINKNLHAFFWESMTQNNCNTYLIDGSAKVLIDPGHAEMFYNVENELKSISLSIEDIDLIICTHAHPDHIESVRFFSNSDTKITIHGNDWQLIKSMEQYVKVSFSPDFFLKDGDLNIGDIKLKIYHTPGHSPGSITVYWPEQKTLFTGDLIFNNGLGRTDLPGGDGEKLKDSIIKLSNLETEIMLSGHGNMVSGADAVKKNFETVQQYWFSFI